MKRLYTKSLKPIHLGLIMMLSIALLSNSNGRATQASEGNTGAPGDNAPGGRTCINCHGTGIDLQNTIQVKDLNGDVVNAYTPGETYTVSVTLSSNSNPAEYGFQLVGELDDESAVNGFSNPSSNAKLVTLGNGRQYAEQDGPSSTGTFEVEWTAPMDDVGNINFYSAGIGTNDNGMSSGDGAALAQLTISGVVSTQNKDWQDQVNIYPNPTADIIYMDGLPERTNYQLIDSNGSTIIQGKVNGSSIDLSNLSSGIYFLQLINESKISAKKIVKN